MRIALLTPTFFQFSGIDRVVELDVARLAKDHEVTVYCLAGDIRVKGVTLVQIGMPKNQFLSRVYRLFFFLDAAKRRRIGGELAKFDEIHTHFYPMSVLAADAKRRNPKLTVIEHDYGVATPSLFDNFHERLYLRVFKRFSYRYMKKADRVISISHYLAGILKDEAGIDATVEHIAIDSKRFRHGVSGARVRKKHGLGDAPVCMYVGRLSPHKGIHDLIGAYNIAKQSIPTLKLLIGGKPTFKEYQEQLVKAADGDKDIMFIGFVPDNEIAEYYAAATVYTTATHWEGFDMPIPEAAACGTPTVAFDLCSHPEVTKDGILVKENDLEAFAAAIVTLVKKRLGARVVVASTSRASEGAVPSASKAKKKSSHSSSGKSRKKTRVKRGKKSV